MARHGENIRKRTDGRWEGRYLAYSPEKGKKIYRSVYGRSYEEVRDKLTTQKSLLKGSGGGMGRSGKTAQETQLKEFAEEWLQEVRAQKKYSTYIKYATVYNKHIAGALGECRLSGLKEARIEEELAVCGSESIRKSIYCVLNQIIDFAGRKHGVFMPRLRKPAFQGAKAPAGAFSRTEQKKLFQALQEETDAYGNAILLSLHTGMRIGEVCALKWADVDMEDRLIAVARTVQRIQAEEERSTKTVLMESSPKSQSSKREIPLSPSAMEVFSRMPHSGEYVFGGKKQMDPRTLQYRFQKLLQRAGLPKKSFHALRHTFATNCVESGTDVKSLSEMLGHSDVKITLNRYVHPSMDTKRRCMDRLSVIYGQFLG